MTDSNLTREPLKYSYDREYVSPIKNIPITKKDEDETNLLLQTLQSTLPYGGGHKDSQDVRPNVSSFHLPHSNIIINRWRYPDSAYYRKDLITKARGLFVARLEDGTEEIASRGYDKFFNIGENKALRWETLEETTRGPYYLTAKENGCIIFISGLSDGTLLVCSKGQPNVNNQTTGQKSHAAVGEQWLKKQLYGTDFSVKDLARVLQSMNVTAVAELCDDSFEEHVLEYGNKRAGLYLHGLNVNTSKFKTYPMDDVRKFGNVFRFKKVDYTERSTLQGVKEILQSCEKTGTWNGREIEGFVIRCKTVEGSDFFFKFKFNEPYLMYRYWREVARKIIDGDKLVIDKYVKITKSYAQFARSWFNEDPERVKLFKQNKGIFALRKAFLEWKDSQGQLPITENTPEEDNFSTTVANQDNFTNIKFILVPIATIGCGKTTLAVALSYLFGWGHVQNDNVTVKKGAAEVFADNIAEQFSRKNIVIADRNNHMRRERSQLYDALEMRAGLNQVKFIALHFDHSIGRQAVFEIAKKRVDKRGDNHQSINAESGNPKLINNIMQGFLTRFQPYDDMVEPDSKFDYAINLRVDYTIKQNLQLVIQELSKVYPSMIPTQPTDKELNEAIKRAGEYVPEIKKYNHGSQKKNKPNKSESQSTVETQIESKSSSSTLQKKIIKHSEPWWKNISVRYFALELPDAHAFYNFVKQELDGFEDGMQFFNQLRATGRIQRSFHVTLLHQGDSGRYQALWQNYFRALTLSNLDKGTATVIPKVILWNKRVMAVIVDLHPNYQLPLVASKVYHITVGTASPEIPAFESNKLVETYIEQPKSISHRVLDGSFGYKHLSAVAVA
ncbi:RNA ligase-domain-containing protein [Lipomyces japonicus]|uniref:RNA ligase-domain-containing protein n=1 Tax=Lipomyces japonicus TaxID=56871 RepID=UPI0034CE25C5